MTSQQNTLHQQAIKIANDFRKAETALIHVLEKIDDQRIYLKLGFSSLFAYVTQSLKLSEALAYGAINIARKSKSVPELKQAVVQGRVSMSKAARVVSVINKSNEKEILSLAESLPKRELERKVAEIQPKKAVQEKTRYIAKDRLELKLGVSHKLMEKLSREQDVVSRSEQRSASLEDTLAALVGAYLEKKDPIIKAKRAEKRKKNTHSPKLNLQKRKRLSASSKHSLVLQTNDQCTHVDVNGRRCQERRWLHVHHKRPKSCGGGNELTNLEILCAGHHRSVHIKNSLKDFARANGKLTNQTIQQCKIGKNKDVIFDS